MKPNLKSIQKNITDLWVKHRKLVTRDAQDKLSISGISLAPNICHSEYAAGQWWLTDLSESLHLRMKDGTLKWIVTGKTLVDMDELHDTALLLYDSQYHYIPNGISSTSIKLMLLDLKTATPLLSTERTIENAEHRLLYNTVLYYSTHTHFITALDMRTGQTIWTTDTYHISKSGQWDTTQIQSARFCFLYTIGIVKKVLWIAVEGGILLGLDRDTGQPKHLLEQVTRMTASSELSKDSHWKLPSKSYGHTQYDSKNQQLVGLMGAAYWIVDLKEPKPMLKMWRLQEDFDRMNMNFENSDRRYMTTDYIYFVSTDWPRIAALNRKTLKLDWVYHASTDFPEMGVLMQIAVIGNNLYVRDSERVLYTFELK